MPHAAMPHCPLPHALSDSWLPSLKWECYLRALAALTLERAASRKSFSRTGDNTSQNPTAIAVHPCQIIGWCGLRTRRSSTGGQRG